MNNQSDNQEFGFGDLDSLQEQVALKNSAQENEKEPKLTQQVENKEALEVLEDENVVDDEYEYQKYLDSLPKKEIERLEQEYLEIALAEEEERRISDEIGREQMEFDKTNKNKRKPLTKQEKIELDSYFDKKIKDSLSLDISQTANKEKTQEEINLEYSLAKMKQDLSQSQEKKQEVDLTFPAQKREFLSETLEIVDKGITENIKESLSVLDRLDAVEVQIAKKEKEIEKEFNAEQNKDSSSPSILDSKIDEALQEKQQEQQESHQKELEALQKEKETLQRNFEASIENLIKQGDVKDLLKNLQTLDEAFAKFLKKTKEECDLLAKQRIETLELTMQSESVKVVVSGFVKELHNNRKEVKEQSKELELQKECYQNLDKLQRECLKGNEKAKSELEQEMKSLEEKHPAFKENYPKFYEKLEQTLKEPQRRQEKQQENTRERSA